jgi:hypothetical protein
VLRKSLRFGAAIIIVSIFVHFLWEMLQSFAYDMGVMPLMRVVLYHLWATLGDAVLMVVIYGAVALAARNPRWAERPRPRDIVFMLVLGLVLAVAIERQALATGRWAYSTAMPMIPGLDVGLLPVAQLLLLPLPIYWAARRLAG